MKDDHPDTHTDLKSQTDTHSYRLKTSRTNTP